MRIERPPYVVDISRAQAARQQSAETRQVQKPVQPKQGRSQERVEISIQARELAKLKQQVDEMPDVRRDRVALAKQNMNYGGYRVDPVVLAQKMMESIDTVA